jgi:hypothetical protein
MMTKDFPWIQQTAALAMAHVTTQHGYGRRKVATPEIACNWLKVWRIYIQSGAI